MSLVRLLELGRSLNVIEATQSRYRMARQNLLPKFGSTGGAIRLAPVTATSPAWSPATNRLLSELPNVLQQPSNRKQAPFRWAKSIRNCLGPLGHVKEIFGEMTRRFRKAATRSGADRPALRQRPASSVVLLPRTSTGLVQPELSLDNVKVVRNDLSDMDLELVQPVTMRESLEQGPSARAAMALSGTWGRLKARLFQVPVGYQNEAGFHRGTTPAENESGWPPVW